MSLNKNDFVRGLIVAILAAVVAKLGEVLNVPGFDFVQYDWTTLVSVAVTAALAYLAKNFGSDNSGKFAGKIG